MSTVQHAFDRPSRRRVQTVLRTSGRLVFGDRTGLVLFLAAMWLFVLYWRVGFFITDNYTVANTLVSVADGRLYIEKATFGSLGAPGTVVSDGKVYGRNYGQIFLALPVLWGLRALGTVGDLPVVLLGGWTLLTMAVMTQTGHLLDRRRTLGFVGALVAALLLVANLAAVARPIPAKQYPLVALQLATMIQGAFVGVVLYRLLASWYDRRIGVVAGAFGVVATPVAFWSVVPKRHVLATLLVVVCLYALYRSREVPTDDGPVVASSYVRFRALAYVTVGVTAWVHAAEGFVLFVALLVADVPTAPRNDRRTLAAVGAAFLVSLVPFFLTNYAITGSPVEPPRMLPALGEQTATGGIDSGKPSDGETTGETTTGLFDSIPGVALVTRYARVMDAMFVAGFEEMVSKPRLVRWTFLRRGYPKSEWVAAADQNQAIYLTILEAAPVLAALAMLPGRLLGRASRRFARTLRNHVRPTDVVVLVYVAGITTMYIRYFPMPAQITVRYFTAFYPLLLYLALRQRPLRRVLDRNGTTVGYVYAATVLVGTQVFVAAIALLDLGLGETFQLHALASLVVAALLAVTSLAAVVDERADGAVAVLFGVGGGLGTTFVLLAGLEYFEYGTYVLPLVRWATTLVEVVSL